MDKTKSKDFDIPPLFKAYGNPMEGDYRVFLSAFASITPRDYTQVVFVSPLTIVKPVQLKALCLESVIY